MVGFIPEITRESEILSLVANFKNQGISLNAEKLINATCYARQLRPHLPGLTPTTLKITGFGILKE